MRRAGIAAILYGLLLTTACLNSGMVAGKSHNGGIYKLLLTSGETQEWKEVLEQYYNSCHVGDAYPNCATG